MPNRTCCSYDQPSKQTQFPRLIRCQDQPLLRLPHELSRRNQKTAQRYVENTTKDVLSNLTAATKSKSPDATLASLDSMLSKMQGLKRKLEGLHEEEMRIHKANRARLQHLQDVFEVQSLVDVKYDEWSRTRLSRLLVDYLLREGYAESAAHLAASQNIEELVDVDAFVACHKIERSLREERSTGPALAWCKENAKELKKQGSTLEFELRLQQYIELVRQGHEAGIDTDMDGMNGVSLEEGGKGERRLVEARAHARKYLTQSGDAALLGKAAGLLAYRPWDDVAPYAVRCPPAILQKERAFTNTTPGSLLPHPLVPPRHPLPHHPPHTLLPPTPPTPPHRPLSRPLRPQNPRLPLPQARRLGPQLRVPHLQHRAQRTRPQRAVRPPLQEPRRARPRRAAQRPCRREGAPAAVGREGQG